MQLVLDASNQNIEILLLDLKLLNLHKGDDLWSMGVVVVLVVDLNLLWEDQDMLRLILLIYCKVNRRLQQEEEMGGVFSQGI